MTQQTITIDGPQKLAELRERHAAIQERVRQQQEQIAHWNEHVRKPGEPRIEMSFDFSDLNSQVCVLCGDAFAGFGNNPAPFATGDDDRCCDDCNELRVIPARQAGERGGEFLSAVASFQVDDDYADCIGEFIMDGDCDWKADTCEVWATRLDDKDAEFIDCMAEYGFPATIETRRGIPKPGWTKGCGGFAVTFQL